MASAAAAKTRSQQQPTRGKRHEPAAAGDDDHEDDQEEQARERDLVEAYVAEHALERTLTDLLNDVVADRPADPLLALSSLLLARSTASARGVLHVQLTPLLAPAHCRSMAAAMVQVHTAKGVFTSSCSPMGDSDGRDAAAAKATPLDYLALNEALNEALVGLDPVDQGAVDEALEGLAALSETHGSLPRHVSLACSLAACQAGAKFAEQPLRLHIASLAGDDGLTASVRVPMPLFSVVNGGVAAANKLFAQEVFLAPVSAVSFSDALAIGAAFHRALRKQLDARGVGFSNGGAFGGFAPQLQSLAEVFQLLRAALDDTRAELSTEASHGEDDAANGGAEETAAGPTRVSNESVSPLEIAFGVDFAASEFVLGAVPSAPHPTDAPNEETGDEEPPSEATEEASALPPPPSRPAYTYDTDKWVPGSSDTFKVSDELLEIVRSSILELSLATVVDPFAAVDGGSMAALVAAIEQDGAGTDVDAADADSKPPPAAQVVARAALYPQFALSGSDEAAAPWSVAARIEALAMDRACDSVALELRQFATLSQLLRAVGAAQRFGLGVVLGASAGDCAGDGELLAAVALGAGNVRQIKFGGLLSSDSIDRYNHVLLASMEADAPPFAGREPR